MTFHRSLPLLLILCILAALWQCWRIKRPSAFHRWLGALTALALLTEVTGYVLLLKHTGNVVLYNAFGLVEFVIILVMVHALFPRWSTVLALVGAAGALAMGISLWSHSGLAFLLTEGIITMDILITAVALAVLWQLTLGTGIPLQRVPEFWLFLGLIAYFGGIPPILGAERYVYHHDPALAQRLYSIIPFLAMVRYLLTAVACSMAARASRTNSPAWQA